MLKVFIISYLILGVLLASKFTREYRKEGGKFSEEILKFKNQIILILVSVPIFTILIVIARVKPTLLGELLVWARRKDDDEDDGE